MCYVDGCGLVLKQKKRNQLEVAFRRRLLVTSVYSLFDSAQLCLITQVIPARSYYGNAGETIMELFQGVSETINNQLK